MQKLIFHKSKKQRIKNVALPLLMIFVYGFIGYRRLIKDDFGFAILNFAVCLIALLLIIHVLSNKVTVTVDEKGVKNKTNFMGLIEWKSISHFELKKAMGRKFIVIHLNDVDAFLKSKRKVSRTLMKSNIKKLGSPAVISEFEFDKDLDLVVEELNGAKAAFLNQESFKVN